ncbi:MAG: PIN domain-containing protein [Sphingomonadaceae bacterium]
MALTSLDTNILVYAFQAGAKHKRSLAILDARPVASVQILNEYAHLSRRKLRRSWREIEQDLDIVRTMAATVEPITEAANREALRIVGRYQLSFYDSVLLAVALESGVETLYSEDMQDGLVIDERLTIVDPYGCS